MRVDCKHALSPISSGSIHGGAVSGHISNVYLGEVEQTRACCPGDLTDNVIPGWDNPWIDLGGEG